MARKEQIMVSELSDDAPERETVVNRIISRSKETITKLTTVSTTLKEKKTKSTDEQAGFRTEIKDLTEKLTTLQAKIVTDQENLKLKTAERKSKREILKSYGKGKGQKTPSAESSIITQAAIDKLTKEIKELRKKVKKNIQQKNEQFSTKVTTQKKIDLLTNQIKTIDIQVHNLKDFTGEVENTIEIVEAKIKEEIATKKVIETQKEAFKAAQKKTDAEEELNSTRVVTE
jgi:chromosome segregation ATPase